MSSIVLILDIFYSTEIIFREFLFSAHGFHRTKDRRQPPEFFMKDAVDKGLIKGCSIRFANVYSNHERFAKHIIPHIIDSLSKTGEVILSPLSSLSITPLQTV